MSEFTESILAEGVLLYWEIYVNHEQDENPHGTKGKQYILGKEKIFSFQKCIVSHWYQLWRHIWLEPLFSLFPQNSEHVSTLFMHLESNILLVGVTLPSQKVTVS